MAGKGKKETQNVKEN